MDIEIDGRTYQVKPFSRALLNKFKNIQKKLGRASSDAEKLDLVYENIGLSIDAPAEVIEGLDVTEINRIQKFLLERALEAIGKRRV